MATRPTTSAAWADGAGASTTDPGVTKRALGWVWKERPPHGFMNWWQKLVGEWLDWQDDQGIYQYDSFLDLLNDTAENRVSLLLPAAGDPWQKVWVKSEVQLGGAGHSVAALATNGSLHFVATDPVGTDWYLKAFEADTGTEEWSVYTNTVATATLFMHCDGDYLIVGVDDAGVKSCRVYDSATGALLNTIAQADLVDGFSDGDQLYLVQGNPTNTINAYSDYSLTGAEVLEWTDTPGSIGNLLKVTSNGSRVFLGAVLATNALKIYERDGTVVGLDDPDCYGNTYTTVVNLAADEDNCYIAVDTDKLLAYPANVQLGPGDLVYPLPLALNQMFSVGAISATNNLRTEIGAVTENYIVSRTTAADAYGIIYVFKKPSALNDAQTGPATGEGGGPVLSFAESTSC